MVTSVWLKLSALPMPRPDRVVIERTHSPDGPSPEDVRFELSFAEVTKAAEVLRDHLLCMMPPRLPPSGPVFDAVVDEAVRRFEASR